MIHFHVSYSIYIGIAYKKNFPGKFLTRITDKDFVVSDIRVIFAARKMK